MRGKTALVTGISDNVGFAWYIAKTLQAAGADIIIACHPRVKSILDRFLVKDKYKESRKLPFGEDYFAPIEVMSVDVAYDNLQQIPQEKLQEKGYEGQDISVAGLFEKIKTKQKNVDFIIHSIAFSPEVTKTHLQVSRGAYMTAMSISSYSLVSMCQNFVNIMQAKNASIIALSYMASEKVVPYYGGGMSSAKAALECDAKNLAWFLGEYNHRVNIISAGPYASRAAKSIGNIDNMITQVAQKSPLKRPISPQDVADTALFLCSDLSQAITGEVIHVDNGYNIMD